VVNIEEKTRIDKTTRTLTDELRKGEKGGVFKFRRQYSRKRETIGKKGNAEYKVGGECEKKQEKSSC